MEKCLREQRLGSKDRQRDRQREVGETTAKECERERGRSMKCVRRHLWPPPDCGSDTLYFLMKREEIKKKTLRLSSARITQMWARRRRRRRMKKC